MKRVLAFVALFATGLAVLLWFQHRSASERPSEPVAPPAAPSEPQDEPLTPVKDAEGQTAEVGIGGALDSRYKPPETGRLRSHVTANTTRLLPNGEFELGDFRIEFYDDRGDGGLESDARADRARGRVDTERIDFAPLDESAPITLYEAKATLHRGSRFAPVVLTVPVLTGQFATKTFSSDDPVDVRGRGLSAKGRGLVVDGTLESLRLLHDPQATIESARGELARVKSTGEFSIVSRPDLGLDVLEITARDSAELTLAGARPWKLRADVVRLFGTLRSGADDRFVPTRAEAEGRVVLEPSEGVFSGARAQLEFVDGEPMRAALDGEPKLDLVLRGERLADVPPELLVEGETLTVAMRGAGPLELFADPAERFVFTGPATLELPAVGATLAAEQSIEGAIGAGGRFEELTAIGGAKFDYERAHIEADDLLLRAFVDARGRVGARLIGVGSTHATGELADSRPFDLLARRGLVAERVGDDLRVPTADDVELRVDGEDGFTARADHVRDVDLTAMTLAGEGGVRFEGAGGTGRGERLEVLGPSRGELWGSELTQAHFEHEQGTFEARYITFDGARVQARIDAHAVTRVGATDVDVRADWVVVERREAGTDPSEPSEGGAQEVAGVARIELLAGGDVECTAVDASESWKVSCAELRAYADESRDAGGKVVLEPTHLVASAGVGFEYAAGDAKLTGRGDRLVVSPDRRARLFAAPGTKATLAGSLDASEVTLALEADEVEFAPGALAAIGFDATVQGLDLSWHDKAAPPEQRFVRAVGERMTLDERELFLVNSYLGGPTAVHGDWSFDAPFLSLSADAEAVKAGAKLKALRDLMAWGGFAAELGKLGRARGESLQVLQSRRSATLTGEPARLERPGLAWQSTWLDLDLGTGYLRADAGDVRSSGDSTREAWSLRYASIEPLVTPDETIQVLREPVLTQGSSEFRASWAIAWLDRGEWMSLSGALERGEEPARPAYEDKPASLFDRAGFGELSRWLREVYLEGEIEYRVQGERRARADTAYFDLVQGNGWLRNIDLNLEVPLSRRGDRMKVQADTLRHSLDGSLEATNAVVTSCSYDEPHYVIKIGDFSMLPRWKDKTLPPKATGGEPQVVKEHDGWDFALENNVIASPGGFEIPMPRIAFPTNNEFEIDPEALEVANLNLPSVGQDSKFGAFVSTSFATNLSWIARGFRNAFNFVFSRGLNLPALPALPDKIDERTTIAYLGSRGGRVGVESSVDDPNRYHFEFLFDLVYDRGKDRGLVRVPEDDRDEFRTWFRSRNRYLLDAGEWIDAVVTWQSDPGVQAEFFERDYLEYEERESYLHYRRAEGGSQWHATLEARLEDFRTEVVDQPSIGYFRGRSKVGSLGRQDVVYSSSTTIEHLARYEGEVPYEQPFPDGLGERDVTRFDTTQRIETPVSLGLAGLRATPFVSARATGWSDNARENDPAARAVLFAGAELATTFWKLFASGSRHSWTPSIGYRADLGTSDSGLPVAQFDDVDASLEGQFLDAAVRSRWEYRELKSDLDIELRQTYANDVPTGQVEGLEPLWVRGSWLSRFWGMPFGATHDGRFDLDDAETDFSRTFFGWEPRPDLDLETGHLMARDLAGDRLYEALTVGARYALSTKWEIDGRYTFSIGQSGQRLGSSLLLRRIGHDFVFEVESSYVAGEGASSLKFNLTPLLTWKADTRGMLDRWRATRD